MNFFENFERKEKVQIHSEKNFGLTMATFFFLAAIIKHKIPYLGIAGVLVFLIYIKPGFLKPFNRAWFFLGQTLHKLISPVILTAVFFGIFTPFRLLMKVFRQQPLEMGFNPAVNSYWKKSEQTSFLDQF